MIVEFSVENFGSIKDVQKLSMLADRDDTLSDYYVVKKAGLRLLKLAMIYGPNASGKTMILKALDLVRNLVIAPKFQKNEALNIFPFQFDEKSRELPTRFRLVFVQNDIKYDYSLEVKNQYVAREEMFFYPKGRASEIFTRETDANKQVAFIHAGSTVGVSARQLAILEGNTLWNNTVLGAFSKSNIDWPELQGVFQWFKDNLQMLIAPDVDMTPFADKVLEASTTYKSLMVSFLEKADVQIMDVKILKEDEILGDGEMTLIPVDPDTNLLVEEKKIKFQAQNRKITRELLLFTHEVEGANGRRLQFELPWNFQSNGTLRYYGLAAILALLIKTTKVNLIDEFDTALHPDLMKHFLLTFLANSTSSQLILTTHNIHLMNEKDVLRNDAVWFTQKRNDGSTELYSLADFGSGIFRKNGSIVNAYRIGKLGALPKTGSIFIAE